MVRFLLGRAGSGKTQRVIWEIAKAAAEEGEIILLVPEQYSHATERLLCGCAGAGVSKRAEVLSFRRLTDRIFMQAGGLARKTVDQGGRILLMRRALTQVKDQLTLLSRAAQRPEFLKSLIDVVEEMKTCCIAPESLLGVGEGLLAQKLHDIALIAAAYDGAFESGELDPADELTLAGKAAQACGFFRGMRVWIDGYSGFTPQEIEILRLIFAQSAQCTVSLCLNDDPEAENGAFSKAWDTYSRLERIAGRSEVTFLELGARYEAPALAYLEKNLFSAGAQPEPCHGAVELYSARDIYEECAIAAARILTWVRKDGLRYRDIVVTARNFEEYAPTLAAVFQRFGVPFYENQKQPVLSQPPVAFTIGALRVIADRFRYDDVAAYLKTGLCGVRRKSLDRLEHYLYTWHVEGKLWTQDAPFMQSVSGRDREMDEREEAELRFINRLRTRVREPLMHLQGAISKNPTGRGFAEALFGFFEEVHLARRLEARTILFRMRGDLARAEQYEKLWQLLVSAIESIARVLPDERFTVDEFARVFSLMLSQYEVGTIPTALDRVHAGGFERLGEAPARRVIILGAVDGRLPMHTDATGLFSDAERERLEEWGVSLAISPERRIHDEFRLIYTAAAAPSERLVLTVPQLAADGGEARESFLIARLQALFPDLEKKRAEALSTFAPRPCFDLAAARGSDPWRAAAREYFSHDPEYAARLALAGRAAKIARGPLRDRENIDALFGKTIRLSASRTDCFSSCRYQYFLKYGLRLVPQRRAGLDAPEIGTFVHEILEKTLREVKARGGHRAVETDDVLAIADRAVEEFIAERLGGFAQRTARFRTQFLRLRRMVRAVVTNVHEELRASRFEPLDFELHFSDWEGDLPALTVEGEGFSLKLEGFVDRVDGCEVDDTLYLRVVDYKTGGKDFRLDEVLNGLNMQMLLYLFTLCDMGSARYGKAPEAAGVLYLPAKDPILPAMGGESEDALLHAREAASVRRGLLLDRPELYPDERFLPVRLKKDGEFDAKSAVASREDFLKISKRIDRILSDIGSELHAGVIEANPYYKNAAESACDFCDMRGACHFDERAGDRKRYLFAVRKEDL